MYGVPHGVISVQRPDTAQSIYEMRHGKRYGKETFRHSSYGVYNTTWTANNSGSNYNSATLSNERNAFYNKDGSMNTANKSNWRDYD